MPVCVECGSALQESSLYTEYAGREFVLAQCATCSAVCDKYVELDGTLQVLDLVLHKPAIYRHLLFNVQSEYPSLLKLIVVMLMFDVYVHWTSRAEGPLPLSMSTYVTLLAKCILDHVLYVALLSCYSIVLGRLGGLTFRQGGAEEEDFVRAVARGVLIGSFGKGVHLLMVVWRYHQVREYAALVAVNVLSCHAESLSVLLLGRFLSSSPHHATTATTTTSCGNYAGKKSNYKLTWLIILCSVLTQHYVFKIIFYNSRNPSY
jgi:hypothetical protein